MKIVGMLLVVALVIIPAAAARRVAATPEQMAVASTVIGIVSVIAGLFGSLEWDVPAGPAIVLVASGIFAASLLIPVRGQSRGEG
jgi:zinc transport system permease protein